MKIVMQKNNEEFDQFVLDSWENMHGLLDEQMPKDKNRAVIWYWVTGVAVLVLLGIVGLWSSSSNVVEIVENQRVIANGRVESVVPQNTPKPLSKEEGNSSFNSLPKEVHSLKPIQKTTSLAKTSSIQQTPPVQQLIPKQVAVMNNKSLPSFPKETRSIPLLTDKQKNIKRPKARGITHIPKQAVDVAGASAAIGSLVHHVPRPFYGEVYALGMCADEGLAKSIGFRLARKWNRFSVDLGMAGGQLQLTLPEPDPRICGSETVVKASFLEVPVSVHYWIHPRVSMYGGVAWGKLYSDSKTIEQALSTDYSNQSSSLPNTQKMLMDSNRNQLNGQYYKARIGCMYHFSHFQIGVGESYQRYGSFHTEFQIGYHF